MSERPISTTPSDTLEAAIHTPLPAEADHDLFDLRPQASFLGASTPNSTLRDSFAPPFPSSNNTSGNLISNHSKPELDETPELKLPRSNRKRRPLLLILLGLVVLCIIVLVVVLPVYFVVVKPKQRNSKSHQTATPGSTTTPAAGNPTGSGPGSNVPPALVTTGGDGSTVTKDDGSTFTYTNKFGGFLTMLNQTFGLRPSIRAGHGEKIVYMGMSPEALVADTMTNFLPISSVNLGGLFVLEPFISPALYQKYPGAVDEWTLSTLMRADTANGGINQLEDHYNTFVTEEDIAEIAGAGLNWIRLPVPFWAVDVWPGEPFLAQTSWNVISKVHRAPPRLVQKIRHSCEIGFALHSRLSERSIIRIIPIKPQTNFDFLFSGFNHSGKHGQINFLNGVMGIANAQRALEYIRVFTEFISQPQYKDVVPIFGIMNEAGLTTIGRSQLTSFYLEAHSMIRSITGTGEGNGPYISIHDGFAGTSSWAGFLEGADRIMLDTHPYLAFDGNSATSPIDTGTGDNAGGVWPTTACNRWAAGLNNSRSGFGVTVAGEFSNGYNDCGLFLNGVPGTGHSYGGDCADWEDSSNWSAATKAGVLKFAEASMDALGDWFFWTWKIGNSTAGIVESPLWSYQLGLRNGWIPKDPRTALGTCAALGVSGPSFDGTFEPWQTGGAGAGTIAATSTAIYPWPPATISNAGVPGNQLPTYTPTGTVATLAPPTLTASATKSIDVGNGWYDAQDTTGAPTPIAGCTYPPDAWDALDVAVPAICS
ncbi:hypothetical protein DXG01_003284 [Tephrocybe rancida]|nr:hypothetical protein DXG01_003284 [Tephrocybe rancida]